MSAFQPDGLRTMRASSTAGAIPAILERLGPPTTSPLSHGARHLFRLLAFSGTGSTLPATRSSAPIRRPNGRAAAQLGWLRQCGRPTCDLALNARSLVDSGCGLATPMLSLGDRRRARCSWLNQTPLILELRRRFAS
jgi:hypothetical protein